MAAESGVNEMDAATMTDGFHLVVDALKLNGIDTIYGVAGIPITDLARLAQAEGLRYFGFRHEQSAGNAAAICRLSDAEAGYLPDGLGTGVPQRHGGARQRHHQLLPDDPDQRIERPRDRRSRAGRLRRARPDECGKAFRQGGVPRQPTPGYRHRHRARDPCGRLRTARRRLSRPDRGRRSARPWTRKRPGNRW